MFQLSTVMSQIFIRILVAFAVMTGICYFESNHDYFIIETMDSQQTIAAQVRIPVSAFHAYPYEFEGFYDILSIVDKAPANPHVTFRLEQNNDICLRLHEDSQKEPHVVSRVPNVPRITFSYPTDDDFKIHPHEVFRMASELSLTGERTTITVNCKNTSFHSEGPIAAMSFRYPPPPRFPVHEQKTIQVTTRNLVIASKILKNMKTCMFHIVSNTLQITFVHDYAITGMIIIDSKS